MLTVRDSEADKVAALDAGADDYVTKPFNAPELLARIRAALRRTPWSHGPGGRVALGAVEVDFDTREVTSRGRRVRLTPKEFELLRYFVAQRQQGPVRTASCSRPSGGPTTATRWTTCACSSTSCGRRSSPRRRTRFTCSPNRGWATACHHPADAN